MVISLFFLVSVFFFRVYWETPMRVHLSYIGTHIPHYGLLLKKVQEKLKKKREDSVDWFSVSLLLSSVRYRSPRCTIWFEKLARTATKDKPTKTRKLSCTLFHKNGLSPYGNVLHVLISGGFLFCLYFFYSWILVLTISFTSTLLKNILKSYHISHNNYTKTYSEYTFVDVK